MAKLVGMQTKARVYISRVQLHLVNGVTVSMLEARQLSSSLPCGTRQIDDLPRSEPSYWGFSCQVFASLSVEMVC
jgi:hypothetical protein